MIRRFAYSRSTILTEYGRAVAGMCFTGVPLLLFGPSSVIVFILGCFFFLFLLYAIRTYRRSRLTVFLGEKAVQVVGPERKKLYWEDLEELKLSYFSSRRDGEKDLAQHLQRSSHLNPKWIPLP